MRGASDVLSKPFDPDRLLLAVQRLLGRTPRALPLAAAPQ
jgi:DNA-binding response OmpR family regulator